MHTVYATNTPALVYEIDIPTYITNKARSYGTCSVKLDESVSKYK